MNDISTILDEINSVPTRRDLWGLMLDYLHAHGVEMVSYHAVHDDGRAITIAADGFPEDWVRTYIADDLVKIDPIPELAARLAKPFYWHDIRDLAPLSTNANAYVDRLDAAGIGDGLAFYVFGPGLRNAYVGLGFGVDRVNLDPDLVFQFQCVAQAGHLRFCALSDAAAAATATQEPETLTLREREVLNWVAQGKSNSVIASILDMSPHTVDAHIRNIYRKLGVADRTSAALRGVGSGLVQVSGGTDRG